MSLNGNDCLTSSSSDFDCFTPKCYLYDFNEENIKEKIKEILRRLNFLESIIENGFTK